MHNRPGHTLFELAATLVLGGILLGLATPVYRYAGDVIAVRSARDRLLQDLTTVRVLAPLHGGAQLDILPPLAQLEVRTAGRVHSATSLAHDFGVRLVVSGSVQPRVVIRFDALGIGRLASHTIVLERGRARAGVTLSMYGRPRSW